MCCKPKKIYTKIYSIFSEVYIDCGVRIEPIAIAVLPAEVDINIAVQLSVKYVTKVNGIPSSSSGFRYHRLAYTTWGYLAVSFARIRRRSISSK